MPVDMKNVLADTFAEMVKQGNVDKITVKALIEECHISRQTFYYHFQDIPELLQWMIEQYTEQMFQEVLSKGNGEDGRRCFFVMAINAKPYVERGMDSNYGPELERLLRHYIRRFFIMASEHQNFYPECTHAEIKIIVRYHSQAIMGLLAEWTEEDTEQLDQIVHTVYRLTMEGIPPLAKPK